MATKKKTTKAVKPVAQDFDIENPKPPVRTINTSETVEANDTVNPDPPKPPIKK